MPISIVNGINITWDFCVLCEKKTPNKVQDVFCCVGCEFIYFGFKKKIF